MRLPLELVFYVLTSVLPFNPTTLVPASDDGTQLLVSFSIVNHGKHKFAVRKVQQRRIVLDIDGRLRRFLLGLEGPCESGLSLASVFDNISTMYLAPFRLDHVGQSTIRSLVDMPFDSLPPWYDHLNVRPVLHEGLERLVNLEEFVCTRDAVRFSIPDDASEVRGLKPVLYHWPRLRRLGLNRPMCNIRFLECMADVPYLEHVVLTSTLDIVSREFDFGPVYHERTSALTTIILADLRVYKDA
ncbi:hypothetical protein BJ170DRAFT_433043 [Xylariales sp. AK1849]|nr:hypothetical protein BJ170DRAFT_433043 [Xylariales sp. AK1849]